MPTLYAVFDPELPGATFEGRVLLEDWLEKLAEEHGAPLYQFYGQDPSELFDDSELDEVSGEVWFDPLAALEVVERLISALEGVSHPHRAAAHSELEALATDLERASEQGSAFYLAIDI